ncbi:hypothetical protein BMJ34_29175 [Sinorhizobium medicae]|uniref:Uncharacterized protein n=1 Tax=Sinorhizobium medicae TaxID=110321 RepID=A0ABX4TIF2_9HYPH|nr:hypothetical protein BMJ34_29175 [Sinorhizobium medicae]PLT93158.1 hypothetical protein BMJ35_03950 [Sinorhizobium medicae]PLU00635.1 hypothetical protein BMJ33_21025 [Sinorhizobium medicae]PLU14158.1 hypothetical protein BMJ29_27545 [Sinorhizobium medicae]PLU21699.1 hypothetical protein BMJ30_05155 [Sinorhizobium medicae]
MPPDLYLFRTSNCQGDKFFVRVECRHFYICIVSDPERDEEKRVRLSARIPRLNSLKSITRLS